MAKKNTTAVVAADVVNETFTPAMLDKPVRAKKTKLVAVAPAASAAPVKAKSKSKVAPIQPAVVAAAKRGRKPKELNFGIEDIKEYLFAGWTFAEIADELNVSVPTLYNRFPEIKGTVPRGRRPAVAA